MIAAQATLRRRHVDDALRRVESSPHPVVRPPALGDERREVAERGAGELVAGRHGAVFGGQLGGVEARPVEGELCGGDAQRADVRAGDAQVLQRGGKRCRGAVVHAGGQVVDDLEDACRGRVVRRPTDRVAHRAQIDLVDSWGAWRVERGEAACRSGERSPQGGGGPSRRCRRRARSGAAGRRTARRRNASSAAPSASSMAAGEAGRRDRPARRRCPDRPPPWPSWRSPRRDVAWSRGRSARRSRRPGRRGC